MVREEARRHDAARRDAWWGRAREAALLRERFGVQRVVVLGDLVRPEPLHFSSKLTLVVAGLAGYSYELYTALRELGSEPDIEVRRREELSPRQEATMLDGGREVKRLP